MPLKYDKNVVITYESGDSASTLQYQFRKNKIIRTYGVDNLVQLTLNECHQPTDIVAWRDTFSQLTHKSRIYILAHGNEQDGTYIYHTADSQFRIKDLAKLLAEYLAFSPQLSSHQLDADRDAQRLKIALWACYAGFSDERSNYNKRCINKSHAALLAYHLNIHYDIKVDVSGRTNLVIASPKDPNLVPNPDKMSYIRNEFVRYRELAKVKNSLCKNIQLIPEPCQAKLQLIEQYNEITRERDRLWEFLVQNDVFFSYHDLRSKVVYSYRKGYQIVLPDYAPKNSHDRWRWDAFETVIDCMIHTRDEVKQNGLSKLLNLMILASLAEIYHLIYNDLVKGVWISCFSEFGLYNHSSALSKYSPFPSRTVRKLRALLSRFPSDIPVWSREVPNMVTHFFSPQTPEHNRYHRFQITKIEPM